MTPFSPAGGCRVEGWQKANKPDKTVDWWLSMNISVIIWNGLAACSAYSGSQFHGGCGSTRFNALSYCDCGPPKAAVYPLVKSWDLILPYLLVQLRNILASSNQRGVNLSPIPYKYFINMNKLIILTTQYYIQPYLVGSDKRSLALILPSKLVKSLDINPMTILFLLKVAGHDELHLRIIRQENLEKKYTENSSAAAAVVANNQEANNQ